MCELTTEDKCNMIYCGSESDTMGSVLTLILRIRTVNIISSEQCIFITPSLLLSTIPCEMRSVSGKYFTVKVYILQYLGQLAFLCADIEMFQINIILFDGIYKDIIISLQQGCIL